ncbi:unnamed protein product [Polarella glacialis]|uniref:Receptor ligand binding region domain-containing protein n=3 Tax=Polarella glacialis TaxID=89957 RepID=A0A813EDM2_POLGL|nr:unnamed protein product [Polarella glacialis]
MCFVRVHVGAFVVVVASGFTTAAAAAGEWKAAYPPWGEPAAPTFGAPELWIPLIGPFTRHGCFPSRYMSMRIAVSHINRRDSTFCPAIAQVSSNFEIRYELADTSANGIGTASVLMKLLGNETKKKTKAVLGPNSSGSAKAASQILSVFGIPQISWAATSADLSNKASYPYFFRSVSPDSLVMRVLAGFVADMGFKKANVLYFDADFQSGQAEDFRLAAENVYNLLTIPYKLPNSGAGGAPVSVSNLVQVKKSLTAVRSGSCRVVLGLAVNEEAFGLWKAADELGIVHSSGWLWLGADGVGGAQLVGDLGRVDLFVGTFYVISESRGPYFQDFAAQWAADMPTTQVPEFTQMPTCKDGQICQGDPDFTGWVSGVHDTELVCQGYTALAYDAVVTLAVVADRLMKRSGVGANLDFFTPTDWFNELKSLHSSGHVFNCLSGEVTFDENQERPLPMAFYNWQPASLSAKRVASWSAVSGYIWQVGADVVWPLNNRSHIMKSSGVPDGLPSGLPPLCDVGDASNNSAGTCFPCPAGSHGTIVQGTSVCMLCDPGAFQSSSGAQTCTPCSPGYASNQSGLISCGANFICPVGFLSAEPGATECAACPAGRANPIEGSRSCSFCEQGTYQTNTGAGACETCESFLAGSTSQRGALDPVTECQCPEGRFHKPGAGCLACPEGLQCLGGQGLPLQAPGFWVHVLDATQRDLSVYKCRDHLECSPGVLGSCATGREGQACNDCQLGHYKASEGQCNSCEGEDLLLFIVAILICMGVVVVATFVSQTDRVKQNLTSLTAIATAGQLVIVIQTVGVLRHFSIKWAEPAKTLVELTSLLTFDLDVVKVSCFWPQDTPLLRFVEMVLIYPCCAAFLCVWLMVLRILKRPISPDTLFDFNGIVLTVLYISLTLMVLLPFQCIRNPNGIFTMATQPGVTCWTDPVHLGLVGSAVVGILVYPIGICAWILWTTLQYPMRISSGEGLLVLRRYRFLFNRYKSECYYYGAMMLVRNLFVALLPVVLVSLPAIQVIVLVMTLLVSTVLQSRLWPWRSEAANCSDVFLTGAVILVAVAAAPLLEVDAASKEHTLGIVIILPLMCIPLVCLGAFAYTAYARFGEKGVFGTFLCHHKGGAGSLARFIKLIMERHSTAKVFYDSDEVENLDLIFDVVRNQTKMLLVLVTPEVQKRMWCAGEIVSAHSNNVRIVLFSCDGCEPLSDKMIDSIEEVWTEGQKNTLLLQGITIDMVKDAYRDMRSLPSVLMPRFETMENQEEAILKMVKRVSVPMRRLSRRSSAPKKPHILITGAVSSAEALATCQNMQMLVQASTLAETTVARSATEARASLLSARYLVVVLSKGLLEDPAFAGLLLATQSKFFGPSDPIEIVTVNGDSTFEFPSMDFFERLEINGLGHLEVQGLGPGNGPRLAAAYRSLLSVLALPLSPHGSLKMLKEQVKEICRRFRRLDGLGKEGRSKRSSEQQHQLQQQLSVSRWKKLRGFSLVLGKLKGGDEREDEGIDEKISSKIERRRTLDHALDHGKEGGQGRAEHTQCPEHGNDSPSSSEVRSDPGPGPKLLHLQKPPAPELLLRPSDARVGNRWQKVLQDVQASQLRVHTGCAAGCQDGETVAAVVVSAEECTEAELTEAVSQQLQVPRRAQLLSRGRDLNETL